MNLSKLLREQQSSPDRFLIYRDLLLPLEDVKQSPKYHPEGDALYHSLQVFDLARDEYPYDEEILLAALLHDVGKAIDEANHTIAGLAALQGFITPRTAWLIANLADGRKLIDGSLGARAKRRLKEHEDYEALISLAQCDEEGRVPGYQAPDLDEALNYLRELDAES